MCEVESEFRRELREAINRNSKENGSNTPDWILAGYLDRCLIAFDTAMQLRNEWYGKKDEPGLGPIPQ